MLIDGALRSLIAATTLAGGLGALVPGGGAIGGPADDGALAAITVTVTNADEARDAGDDAAGTDPGDVLAELARCVADQGIEVPLPPTGRGDVAAGPFGSGEVVAEIGEIGELGGTADGPIGPVVVSRRGGVPVAAGGHEGRDDELPHAVAVGRLVVEADLAAELAAAADACVPAIEEETGTEVTVEVGPVDDGELVVGGVPDLAGVPADEIGERFEALGECMADAGHELPGPHVTAAVEGLDGGGVVVRDEHDADRPLGPEDTAFVEAFEVCHEEVGLPLPRPGAGIVISHHDGRA